MIDPVAHQIADLLFDMDRQNDELNLGYLHYFAYAMAALEFLRNNGVKDVY